MSQPQQPKPAKLVIGLFLKEKRLMVALAKELSEKFGPVDLVSSWFPFDFTAYYEEEMGAPLFRRMLVFKHLIEQGDLPQIKYSTNAIEVKFSKDGKRRVNLDPGYLLRERFVLATFKNFSHRIYLGKQTYADLTLVYSKGRFRTLPWTYPDYAEENMLNYLERVRNKYVVDLRQAAA